MRTETFVRRSRIEVPAENLYAWHALPDTLLKLTPPREQLEIVERSGGIENGGRVVLRFGAWPFHWRWGAEHREYERGRYFTDMQISGPFAYWKHTHRFEPDGAAACVLEDRVEYALPFGGLGRWLGGWYVRRKLQNVFEYRHLTTAREMAVKRRSDSREFE